MTKRILPALGSVALLIALAVAVTGRIERPRTPEEPPDPIAGGFSRIEPGAAAQNDETADDRTHEDAGDPPERQLRCGDGDTGAGRDAGEIVENPEQRRNAELRERAATAATLAQSRDPEHLLASALLASDYGNKSAFEAMERALAEDPDHPLTLFNFLFVCPFHRNESVCRNGGIERQALNVDGGNGAVWVSVAVNRSGKGDAGGALAALRQAHTAPEFNEYWVEHVGLFERAFAAATDLDYRQRVERAFGTAAAMVSNVARLYSICKTRSETSFQWLHACIDYGERLQFDGDTLMSVGAGNRLQQLLYERLGETKKAADAAERANAIGEEFVAAYRSGAFELFAHDEELLAEYMHEFSIHGEFAAMDYLRERGERLDRQPGYDPCAADGTE